MTLNNYSEEELTQLHSHFLNSEKFIIAKEIGSENLTPHLQCYISFKNPREFNSLKKWNNRLHIEKARADAYKNKEYCSKEGNVYASKGMENVLSKEEQKANFDEWLDHLKHRGRENVSRKKVMLMVDIIDKYSSDFDYKIYEYYHDKFDQMVNCKYCIKEDNESEY